MYAGADVFGHLDASNPQTTKTDLEISEAMVTYWTNFTRYGDPNFHTGPPASLQDEFWRDARNEGHFSYSMSTDNETDLCLVVRYWGAERGNRKFDIYIDEEKLASENNTGKWNLNSFQEVEYGIPGSMIKGRQFIRVKFQALPGASASQVFYIRLARKRTQS